MFRLIALGSLLVGFLALTVFAVQHHGYAGFFDLALANWATRLLFVDLVIALGLCAVWMVQDARSRGAAFAPYLLLTLFLGSTGPLLYLILRQPQPAATQGLARSST